MLAAVIAWASRSALGALVCTICVHTSVWIVQVRTRLRPYEVAKCSVRGQLSPLLRGMAPATHQAQLRPGVVRWADQITFSFPQQPFSTHYFEPVFLPKALISLHIAPRFSSMLAALNLSSL